MPQERVTLFLERAALERARQYSERHDTGISRLVSDFLSDLPVDEGPAGSHLTPIVRRLLGVAAGGPTRADYKEHLAKK